MASDRARTECAGPPIARATDWILLDGDRRLVAALLLVGIFAVVALVALSIVAPFGDTEPLHLVFSALIGGNLTLVTVVVSIN